MSFVAAAVAALTTLGTTATTGNINTSGQIGLAGIAWIFTTQAQPLATFIDSVGGGNSWNAVGVSPYGFGGASAYMYCLTCQNMNGGSAQNFTGTCSGGGSRLVICVQCFAGRATSGQLIDGTPASYLDISFVQTHPGPSYPTANAGSDVAACYNMLNSAAETFGPGAGLTIGVQAPGSGSTYDTQMAEYLTGASVGSHSMGFTTSNFDEAGGIVLALNAQPNLVESGGRGVLGGLEGGLNGGLSIARTTHDIDRWARHRRRWRSLRTEERKAA